MRKMATIRKIEEIRPIDGADVIVCAVVDGWQCVVKKDEFQVGETVIYCEIDSWIPHNIAPFLSKGNPPREYEGILGEKLRTIKLKGQISQGLILPLSLLKSRDYIIGEDVSEELGIIKWEQSLSSGIAGMTKGTFPSFIQKTDQERIQNLKFYFKKYKDKEFEVTIKMDGSSMTVYFFNGTFGVCSRNQELKEEDTNVFWQQAKKYDMEDKLRKYGKNIALQMEVYGEKIQGNPEKISGQDIAIFDVYLIDEQRYALPSERYEVLETMGLLCKHAPILGNWRMPENIDHALSLAEGCSKNPNVKREGIVFKGEGVSFKVISNSYLLKNKE